MPKRYVLDTTPTKPSKEPPSNPYVPAPPLDQPPLKHADRDLTAREKKFLQLLMNDPALDADSAAEKAGFGKKKGYILLCRRQVLASLVRDDQFKSYSWRRLMGKAKKRLDMILDDMDATDKDVITAAKVVLEIIVRAKAVNLAEQADFLEGDAISRVLGPDPEASVQ